MMWKKPDRVVPEMWVGECVFGVVCEIPGLLFLQDKLGYTIGLWAGVLLAAAAAYHMWYVLDTAMDLEEQSAGKMLGSRYLYRYLALIVLVLVLYYSGIGNAFAAFLGYMSMKAAAYMQPVTHKALAALLGGQKERIETDKEQKERGE